MGKPPSYNTLYAEHSKRRNNTLLLSNMTEKYQKAEFISLSDYRWEQAVDSLRQVEILISNGLYSIAVSRLYYGCFYAASSLLLLIGAPCATHAGVKTMLSLHFGKTNLIPAQDIRNYSRLMDRRQHCDYDFYIDTDQEEAQEFFQIAQSFINSAEKARKNVRSTL